MKRLCIFVLFVVTIDLVAANCYTNEHSCCVNGCQARGCVVKDNSQNDDGDYSDEEGCTQGKCQCVTQSGHQCPQDPCDVSVKKCNQTCQAAGCYTGTCVTNQMCGVCQCQSMSLTACVAQCINDFNIVGCNPPITTPGLPNVTGLLDTTTNNVDTLANPNAGNEAYSQQVIDAVNNNPNSGWTAAPNQFYSWSLADRQAFLYGELPPQPLPSYPPPPTSGRKKRQALPDCFDSRTQWPACAVVINNIRNQEKCGSCWAQSSSSVISDRLCIQRVQQGLPLDNVIVSALDIMSCDNVYQGCGGGRIEGGFNYVNFSNVCHGGNYGGIRGCKPYPFMNSDATECGAKACTPACAQVCNPTWPETYPQAKTYMSWIISTGLDNDGSQTAATETAMMQEIMARGTIGIGLDVGDDFSFYAGGIYNYVYGNKSRHAIRFIGWGVGPDRNGVNTKYWIGVNSWDSTWGENGTFRIRKGVNEIDAEGHPRWAYVQPSAIPACFTPPLTSMVAIEDAGNTQKYAFFPAYNAGSCSCGASVTRKAFYSQITADVTQPRAAEIYCLNALTRTPDFSNFCACAVSGECFTQTPGFTNTIPSAAIATWCDLADNNCYSYLFLSYGALTGNRGTQYSYAQQNGAAYGPNSPYIKLRGVSCSGCANIQSPVCTGPVGP